MENVWTPPSTPSQPAPATMSNARFTLSVPIQPLDSSPALAPPHVPSTIPTAPPPTNVYVPGSVATAPAGGYPRVYGFNSENVQSGQAPEQIAMWDETYNIRGGVLIQMYDPLSDLIAIQQRMERAIRDALPTHLVPVVAPPEQAADTTRPPTHFFVTGISVPDTQHLLTQQVLDTAHGTILIIEYNTLPDDFLTTIQGHTFCEDQAADAQQAIWDQLRCDPHITHFISTHCDSFPNHLTADEVVTIFLNSLQAQPIIMGHPGGVQRTYWNVYAPHPSSYVPYCCKTGCAGDLRGVKLRERELVIVLPPTEALLYYCNSI
ncbi:hypothetical protein K435DRAFT_905247 [Dendrothele bispora CBS 962.96]|uniref:Uncharacterized protein n=1 Tax=Dendrothele bispora (strain CBS 962.96) TaxID=1314807 RepID=A0A4S8KKE5_DENBC|nr:hypothetical protein K435DRAFT_905247 [Dendrothele bispora CBS 962.96]